MNKKQIKEFLDRLEGVEGCDFQQCGLSGQWKCKGGSDKSFSKKILTKMGISKDEQTAFLARCDKLGGYCDCEILFNASERLLK